MKPTRLVSVVFLAGFLTIQVGTVSGISWIGGEVCPGSWSIEPNEPTTADWIAFSGPADQVYGNDCVAEKNAGGFPLLYFNASLKTIELGFYPPPPETCPLVYDPVCGLMGEIGSLEEGQWFFYGENPVATFSLSFYVAPEFALLLVKPNGGESFAAGTQQTIQWETQGTVAQVLVEYSTDNGQTWTPVEPPNEGNSGTYQWQVPDANSTECLVRISDANNPDVNDLSDGQFTIFICQRSLAGDLNGDCYVNFNDMAIAFAEWLTCGNPYDPDCF
jgi:hypothetical protein